MDPTDTPAYPLEEGYAPCQKPGANASHYNIHVGLVNEGSPTSEASVSAVPMPLGETLQSPKDAKAHRYCFSGHHEGESVSKGGSGELRESAAEHFRVSSLDDELSDNDPLRSLQLRTNQSSMSEGINENELRPATKRPHILILYTGGTIGMVSTKSGYAPKKGYFTRMVPDILRVDERRSGRRETAWRDIPTFEVIEYEPLLDSSNMCPKNWQRIAQHIYDTYEQADGFIVIHGTDTMTYTASALSFLLQNLSKPVILTGAQVPLCELRTDAHSNLIGALQLASLPPSEAIHEVCIFFNGILLRGNRSNKTSSDSMAGFSSPTYPPLAELGIHISTFKDRYLQTSRGPLRLHHISQVSDQVGIVRLYPGITGEDLEILLSPPLKAAILLTYGIGNGPTSSAVLGAIRAACDRGVVIMNITQCPEGTVFNTEFQSGTELTRCGVVSGEGMTVEACYTKLLFILGRTPSLSPEQIKRDMTEDYAGEMEPPGQSIRISRRQL